MKVLNLGANLLPCCLIVTEALIIIKPFQSTLPQLNLCSVGYPADWWSWSCDRATWSQCQSLDAWSLQSRRWTAQPVLNQMFEPFSEVLPRRVFASPCNDAYNVRDCDDWVSPGLVTAGPRWSVHCIAVVINVFLICCNDMSLLLAQEIVLALTLLCSILCMLFRYTVGICLLHLKHMHLSLTIVLVI